MRETPVARLWVATKATPERAALKASGLLIGIAVAFNAYPVSPSDHFGRFLVLQWGATLFGGAVLAALGVAYRSGPLERFGSGLYGLGATLFGVGLLVEYGWGRFPTSAIFVLIGVASFARIRLSLKGAQTLRGGFPAAAPPGNEPRA